MKLYYNQTEYLALESDKSQESHHHPRDPSRSRSPSGVLLTQYFSQVTQELYVSLVSWRLVHGLPLLFHDVLRSFSYFFVVIVCQYKKMR